MKKVVLVGEAVEDLQEAKSFYNRIEPGVGGCCVDSLFVDFNRLGLHHGFHSVHFGCHRMLASRFPFGIYYLNESCEIRVVAVLDLRRKPSWIRREIRRRNK